jgi:hypothetical protein
MQGEPILGIDNRHCAHMSIVTSTNEKQQWKVADCSTRFRYVCESIPQASKFLESTNSTLLEKIQNADHDVVERFTFRNSIYELSHVKVKYSYIGGKYLLMCLKRHIQISYIGILIC